MTVDSGSTLDDSAAVAALPRFRDPNTLSRWLQAFLMLAILLGILRLSSGIVDTLDEAASQFIDTVWLIVWIVAVVLFLCWTYRIARNVRALGAAGLSISSGWAVGWYFIPIANLWKPYEAMEEIWRASAAPANWKAQERGAILPWWWMLGLIANFGSYLSFKMTVAAKTPTELWNAALLVMFVNGAEVVWCALALALVRKITGMQLAQHAAQAAAPTVG